MRSLPACTPLPLLVAWLGALAVAASAAGGSRQAPGAASAPPAETVTFTADIAPILESACVTCHQPRGSAPFSLATYEEAAARASDIARVTAQRSMPPWKPEPGYGDFTGVRRLSDGQIAAIREWAAAGAPEGAPAPASLVPREANGWRLGEPDLVLTTPAYTVRAGGDDMFRHFVLPVPAEVRRYVKAWEFLPGNPRVVHHATMVIDTSHESRHLEALDPEPGYEGLIAHSAMMPDGYFLDWTPGHSPYRAPEGMAIPLEPGSDVVLMLHLRPGSADETVQARIGLHFTDTPPTRTPIQLRLSRQDFEIPAGESHFVLESWYTLPADVDVYTIQPHAHYLARKVEGFATLPDGTTRWLILIDDWNFDWQDVYHYRTPVFLPAGSTVAMRWTYDNSPRNPRNPNDPPQAVAYGQRTSDEMSELILQVVPRDPGDAPRLTEDLKARLIREEIKGIEWMLEAEPDRVSLHNDVALLYELVEDVDRMAAHFAEAARIEPGSAPAQYNLGTALLRQGRRGEAREAFERALALDPAYANAHRSLGLVLHLEGRLRAAEQAYGEAIRLAPDDAVARHNLGVLQQQEGRMEEAIASYREAVQRNNDYGPAHAALATLLERRGQVRDALAHYREALRVQPDSTAVLIGLARVLATAPDPADRRPSEAVELAERALRLVEPPTAAALDLLAAVFAAAGAPDRAVATAEEALRLAVEAGDEGGARAIRDRLAGYRQLQP